MTVNQVRAAIETIEAVARSRTIIGVPLNGAHLPLIPISINLLKLSKKILNPIVQFASKLSNSELISLELNSANPGPIYILTTDRTVGVSDASAIVNVIVRLLYPYVTAINASYCNFPNIRKAATANVSPNSRILIPWFGDQFALGDTVIAAAAFNELGKAHQKITIVTDDGFGGIKPEILSRVIEPELLNAKKVEIALIERDAYYNNDLLQKSQEIFKQYLIDHDVVIAPSNYGSKTSDSLAGLEAVMSADSTIKTLIGFFDWNAVDQLAKTAIAEEVIRNGANLVLAYLQAQLSLRLSADGLTRNNQYLVPRFRIDADAIERSKIFLDKRGYDSNNSTHALLIIGDVSSHPCKRFDFEKTRRLIEQSIDETSQLGKKAFIALIDPNSNINSNTIDQLKPEVREKIVYLADADAETISSSLIMAQSRCTFIGLDSYNSHAFGAITNYLADKGIKLDRQQIILLGYWGNLDSSTWLPSSRIPIQVIDARDVNDNPLSRLYELPIGEVDRLGHAKVSIFTLNLK
ncbi:hypothetical protein ACQ4M3_39240 [Leptolyngbya sp. AN03gr2]|uniref:hypothetical protein n=1 Tax=unclassified Leptolyngbya TaxID=2650499 RepID=UPI003D31E7D3